MPYCGSLGYRIIVPNIAFVLFAALVPAIGVRLPYCTDLKAGEEEYF